MDVWPKVRERPSDSTFILESHACLSPPLDVHSFSQLALPCGAELWEERQKLTLRINDFSFWQWEVVPQGVVFCLSPQASGTAR
jgi:hypothetical protein